jgi:hypothetical protein
MVITERHGRAVPHVTHVVNVEDSLAPCPSCGNEDISALASHGRQACGEAVVVGALGSARSLGRPGGGFGSLASAPADRAGLVAADLCLLPLAR